MSQTSTPAARPLCIDLSGRTAVVTGGAGGLGRASAAALVACGATVVVADRPGDRLDAAVAELGETVLGIGTDLGLPENCADLPARALAAAGADQLDILVNAVGVMRTQPIGDLTAAQWQHTLTVNLGGVFTTVQNAAPVMRQGTGSIVTLSSVAGRSGRANAADYAASKAGLLSLTKSAALAYAPGIRVNAVCPGVFLTDMWAGIIADRDREFGPGAGQGYLDEVAAKTPMRRIGDPAEIGATVAFLASDLAAFVTGQALNVDGGLEMN